MPRRKTQEEFIADAKSVHGNRFDYSQVKYVNAKTKVKIYCPIHGLWQQEAHSHLCGHGCPECSGQTRYTTKTYIMRCESIHGNKFDYSLVEYRGNKHKVKIICPVHGVFSQAAKTHLRGIGCAACSGKKPHSNETFVRRAKKVHGVKYDYSLVKYKSKVTRVSIICGMHGVFKQTPKIHIDQGSGCPSCKESRGEKRVADFLDKNAVDYFREKRFSKCRHKYTLPFDFYIPSFKLLIEYDGAHHFKPNSRGGEKAFKAFKRNDRIKTEFAAKYNYKLLRIKYTEFDQIEEILSQHIGMGTPKHGIQLSFFDTS